MRKLLVPTVLLLLFALPLCAQDDERPSCIATGMPLDRLFPDNHREHFVVYTAETKDHKQLLYKREVRAEDEKGRRKAMQEASRACADYVTKKLKEQAK